MSEVPKVSIVYSAVETPHRLYVLSLGKTEREYRSYSGVFYNRLRIHTLPYVLYLILLIALGIQ